MDIPNEAAVFVGLAAGMQLMLIWSAGIAFRSRFADIRRFGAALQQVMLSALRRKEKTEYDDMVAVEMQTSRCKLASCLICMYAACCFVYLLLMQIQIADVWSPILCWALLAHAGYFTSCMYLPCLLSYDIVYILFIVSTLLYLSPLVVTPSQYVEVHMTLLLSLRIPSVVIPSQIKSVALCNVAYFIMLTVRIALDDWYIPADSEKRHTPHRARVLAMELMGSISVMAFACLVTGFLRKRAEKRVEEGASSKLTQQLNAAIALLHLCCDAVVELDSRLRLREHSPELAAMLLRDFQGASLAEMKLTEFMPAMDASKAMTYLQDFRSTSTSSASRRREQQQAHAFISRMVDSGATKIKVEIFQVMYRTPGGEACHLVGIRDITDSKPFVSDEELSDELEVPVQEQASSPRSPSPEVLQPGVNRVCLDLDVTEQMIIASATAPLSDLAGSSIAGMFPQSICMLMKRISEEGRLFMDRNEPLPGKTFTFESLPVHWSPDRNAEEISGFFQLTRNMSGSVHVLMYFQNRAKSCASSPGSPASPLSPFSLSPPSMGRRSSQKDRETRVGRGSRASQQPMTLGSLSTLKL